MIYTIDYHDYDEELCHSKTFINEEEAKLHVLRFIEEEIKDGVVEKDGRLEKCIKIIKSNKSNVKDLIKCYNKLVEEKGNGERLDGYEGDIMQPVMPEDKKEGTFEMEGKFMIYEKDILQAICIFYQYRDINLEFLQIL